MQDEPIDRDREREDEAYERHRDRPLSFPELAVRVTNRADGSTFVDINTFNPDADEEGRARDYGVMVMEGAVVGWEDERMQQLLALWEKAPELFKIAQAVARGRVEVQHTQRAERYIREITKGELCYGERVR